jgi:hypothetical protein
MCQIVMSRLDLDVVRASKRQGLVLFRTTPILSDNGRKRCVMSANGYAVMTAAVPRK